MGLKVVALLSLVFLVEVSPMMIERYSTIEFILNMDADVKCSHLVTIFDEEYAAENEEDIIQFLLRNGRPLTLLQLYNGRINAFNHQNAT